MLLPRRSVICLTVACCLGMVFEVTHAIDSVVSVRFTQYNNPTGDAANGHCCDGRSFICQDEGCDYIFKICLDDGDSANSITGCRYGFKESRRIKNKADVAFGDYIGDLVNPMAFPISGHIPNNLVLKVDVYDKDLPYTDNDFVDSLFVTIPLHGGVQTFHASGSREHDRTSLVGDIEVINLHEDDDHDTTHTTTTTTTTATTTTTTTATTTPVPTTTTPGVVYFDRPNADCDNLARSGHQYHDAVYSLRVGMFPSFDAYCDMSGEGWTVIQRRNDGRLNFFRNRESYINGFGVIGAVTEYWLGLEKIYWLTNQRTYKLRITLQKANGGFVYAEYDRFRIDANYVLYVDGYSGTAGDALNYPGYGGMRQHNGMAFTTYDMDNDQWDADNCGQVYQSGWWFNDCYWANLNGMYRPLENGWPLCEDGKCISWRTIKDYENFSLLKTEMEILPTREDSGSNNAHG